MSGYTPTTEEICAAWSVNQSTNKTVKVGPLLDDFDRWLAEVERVAAEKAYERCVLEMPIHIDWKNYHLDRNPYRAEAYRQERKEENE